MLQTEDFYEKKAKEELFHLNGGESLLDFGCGSASILAYIANEYKTVVGTDFSQSMLLEAENRMKSFHIDNVSFILANETTIWNKISLDFDRITATGVVQYFNLDQLRNFIINSSRFISDEGMIILFDILDPHLYWLWKYGTARGKLSKLFNQVHLKNSRLSENSSFFFLKAEILSILDQLKRFVTREPDPIGYTYHPSIIKDIAYENGLEFEYICSIYYEYRYHAILKKSQ
jgi:cyclopropane fatty-acyl-phospholipid synthase-like methyltransferase